MRLSKAEGYKKTNYKMYVVHKHNRKTWHRVYEKDNRYYIVYDGSVFDETYAKDSFEVM